jgi:hypothetical protein
MGPLSTPGSQAVMHLPQYHPFHNPDGVTVLDFMNLMMILLGLLLSLLLYPWHSA